MILQYKAVLLQSTDLSTAKLWIHFHVIIQALWRDYAFIVFFSWIHEWIISSTNKSSLLGISNKSFCKVFWILISHPQRSLSCWGLCINEVTILHYCKCFWAEWLRSRSWKGGYPLYIFWLYLPSHPWQACFCCISMSRMHAWFVCLSMIYFP